MPYADREKYLAYQRARYQAKKAEYKARARASYETRPRWLELAYRQARVANRRGRERLSYKDVLALPRECCAYCLGPAEELDHCTPLSRGGANTVENIVWACRKCNRLKSDKTVLEFVFNLPRLGLAGLRRASNATTCPSGETERLPADSE